MPVIAKKSLGQNFLINPQIAQKIADAGELKPGEVVIEIGPGTGFLTEKLLATGATIIAIEKDSSLISDLNLKFASEIRSGKLTIIGGDILETDFAKLVTKNYKVIGNIPYYITGAIIEHLLNQKILAGQIILLVQKEVADRIVTNNQKQSILSLAVQAYGQPKIISRVGRGNFRPIPKVDSTILAINNVSRVFFNDITEAQFFSTIKKAFAHKRKLLKSNLSLPTETLLNCDIAEKARAEDLTLKQWKCLITKIK